MISKNRFAQNLPRTYNRLAPMLQVGCKFGINRAHSLPMRICSGVNHPRLKHLGFLGANSMTKKVMKMANNKKHVKRIVPKHLTICVPEPEDDLVEFFQREVQNSMQKGVFRNHAIIAASVAIDYMLLLINDGEFEEPDDLGFRLMFLHDFVNATYGIDNVIMMAFDFYDGFPKWISIAKSVILKIESDRADSAFKLFPKLAKEDLLLLEQYIFSKNGTSLLQFSYNKQGYSDACFSSIEESDDETYELDMREIRNKLVAAFAFDDSYILFSYSDEDDKTCFKQFMEVSDVSRLISFLIRTIHSQTSLLTAIRMHFRAIIQPLSRLLLRSCFLGRNLNWM